LMTVPSYGDFLPFLRPGINFYNAFGGCDYGWR
jgi:hypothetical protein